MKTVLCYGDSNTWGADPTFTARRYDINTRWPGVLRSLLGGGYWVIEEGLGGRTTVLEDPIEPHKNGRTYLPPCLMTHRPLDLVIILLGTNDLKKRFSLAPSDIAAGAGHLLDIVRLSTAGQFDAAPPTLLICPPPTNKLAGTPFEEMFEGAEEKSRRLAPHYRLVAEQRGSHFLDAGQIIQSSKIDAIHWDAEEHHKLATAVAAEVRKIIG